VGLSDLSVFLFALICSISALSTLVFHSNMQLSSTLLVRTIITEEVDRSSIIKVATWTLLVVTVAVVIARQIMKATAFRKIALDDFLILAATV
jgi:hypothetical protein